MTVVWHRVCFEPKTPSDRIRDSEAFARWCEDYFSEFEYSLAGYIVKSAHEMVAGGGRLWNILIPGKSVYASGEPCIIRYLSEHGWQIEDQYVHLYIKYADSSEEVRLDIRPLKVNYMEPPSIAEQIAVLRSMEDAVRASTGLTTRQAACLDSIRQNLYTKGNS